MKKDRSKSIVKNTLSNYLKQGVNVGVFLFLTPYVAYKLGIESFGLWSLMWATIGLFALFDFGYSSAVVKYVSDALGRDDWDRLGRMTATFFWVHCVLGLVLVGFGALFLPFLDRGLDIPGALSEPAKIVFMLLAFRAALGMPMGLFSSILIGFHRQALANHIKILNTLVYALVVYIVFESNPSVEVLGLINLVTNVVANGVLIVICLSTLKGVRVAPKYFDKSLLREITGFSLYSFVIYFSSLLYTRVDAIIIQIFLSLSPVAFYNVAMQTASRAGMFCGQLNNALTPVFAELKGAGETEKIKKTFETGTKISTALAIPLLVGLLWFSGPLIQNWMGTRFLSSIIPLQILVATTLVHSYHNVASNVLSMTGHQRYLAIVIVCGQLLNLALTLLFVVQSFGIVGVAVATLLSTTIADSVIVVKVLREYKIGFFNCFMKTIVPSGLPSLLMVSAFYLIEMVIPATSLIHVAVFEAMGIIIFGVSFYFIGLTREEKDYYQRGVIGKLRKKLKI